MCWRSARRNRSTAAPAPSTSCSAVYPEEKPELLSSITCAVHDCEYDNLITLLANLIDDDVWPLDEFVRPGVEPARPIRANPGTSSNSSLRKIRSMTRCAAR